MSESRNDPPFYVGYHSAMDPELARFVKRLVAASFGIAILLAIGVAAATQRANPGRFEYGVTRSFAGWIEATPVPALLIERPGSAGAAQPYSRFLLCGFGKHGVADRVAGLDGREVELTGTLISRDGVTMVELADANPREVANQRPRPVIADEDLGEFTLRGEIVDSKCWLGVMKPGEWKVHRACATRCIAGGVPPIFVVDHEQGGALQFVLVGERGEAVNDAILDRIAEPLVITGRVVRRGATLFLHANPNNHRRSH
jgi:hypothetical protein